MEVNIYCDESCHLEKDGSNIMVLGAITCQYNHRKRIFDQIRQIKVRHGLSSTFEIKWNKVSQTKLDFYIELVDYFFNNPDLYFRAIVIDKTILNHHVFNQTHDDFYYKMYFLLFNTLLDSTHSFNIYLDIKDTKSTEKVQGLKKYLQNANYDYSSTIVNRIQEVKSNEIELVQLVDLLIGALGYHNRFLESKKSKAKDEVIKRIQLLSKKSLTQKTFLGERKFNLLFFDKAV